ncbi:hypothetical protein Nepgr_021872 [Nepenthes gracilis]|uniref:Uncharacterized protein n=1 Tax=Nepenthes gracilis TaxID=150966 RepID=A0AAD3T1L5_NEPGR|nr:hypothetical protein Nepgr_021872 [Nepenthes gracilis]
MRSIDVELIYPLISNRVQDSCGLEMVASVTENEIRECLFSTGDGKEPDTYGGIQSPLLFAKQCLLYSGLLSPSLNQVLNQPDTDGILGCENEDEKAVAMVEDSPSGIGNEAAHSDDSSWSMDYSTVVRVKILHISSPILAAKSSLFYKFPSLIASPLLLTMLPAEVFLDFFARSLLELPWQIMAPLMELKVLVSLETLVVDFAHEMVRHHQCLWQQCYNLGIWICNDDEM